MIIAMIAMVFAMIATILLRSGKWLQIVTACFPHSTPPFK